MNYNNIQMIYKAKDLTIKSNDKDYHFDELVKSNINEFLGKYNPFDMNLQKMGKLKVKKFDGNSDYDDLKIGKYYSVIDILTSMDNEYVFYYVSNKTKTYIEIIEYKFTKTRIINSQSYYDEELVSDEKWKYSKTKNDKKIYYDKEHFIHLFSLYEYNMKDIQYILKNNMRYVCVNGNRYSDAINLLMKDNIRKYRDCGIFDFKRDTAKFDNCGYTYKGLIITSDNETQNLMNYYELIKIIDMLMCDGKYMKNLKMAKELINYEFNKYNNVSYGNKMNYDDVSSIIQKYV